MSSREEFEAWFRANHYWAPEHDPLVRHADDEYIMLRTHVRWMAWQASRAALVIELPHVRDFYGCEGYEVSDVQEAIEAAGVKVKP